MVTSYHFGGASLLKKSTLILTVSHVCMYIYRERECVCVCMCIVYTYIIHSFTLCVANARPSLSPGCLCPKCWRGIVLDGSTWFILVNDG